jgi:type I restriction enzyme S subunit
VRQANKNNKHIENLQMITPSISSQKNYVNAVNLIELQKSQAQHSLQKGADLFNSLLQKAFKGELTT